ncbi:Crp/Fnr family transcriptional regulator [Cytobacillus sp. IB215665]|uniref:Crp/Fnr family transcriptional regulator n=1 Tax=Cytobacillus sp. IB215665 TaxID=3097357 RepID=UPI002A122DD5|nr:Crp/Fnr family transcriptional regulator [Cytobacillus sp. IB215665]MDX8367943.1 Crp/Fnr family transcriptional regulator [Cytobacillus sp. IB215665]
MIVEDTFLKESFISKWSISNFLPEEMVSKLTLCRYDQGELVIDSKDNMQNLHFLVMGKVKAYTINQEGKVFLFKFFNPFSVFGELEYVTKQFKHPSFYLETMNESYVLKISWSDLSQLTPNNKLKLMKYLNELLAQKLTLTTDLLWLFVYTSLEERLARYLLEVSNKVGSFQPSYTVKIIELAQLLGTSNRHLLRTIKKMTDQGLIMKEKNEIKIINEIKLKEMVIKNLYEL